MIIAEAKKLDSVKEYYFSKKLQQISDMRSSGKDIINLGIGNPDLKPSQKTINKLIEYAKKDNTHGYQSYKGTPKLRQAIATWYQKTYGVKVNPRNQILPLIGSKEGIMHISMSFINQGDEVLIPNPGYPTYTSVSKLAGAKIKYYELDETKDWAINIDKLEKEDLSKVKIMWINYPHMPTGANADLQQLQRLISLARKEKFLICNDNPYSLILNDEPKSIFNCEGAEEVALELNSLSKSHNMAGWRIGWVLGHEDYIQSLLKFKSNMDSGMFLPMQEAAAEALTNSAEWHKEQNKNYKERIKYVYKIFDTLNCEYSKKQSGMFVWAKIPKEQTGSEDFVEEILNKANVFITPGFIFGTKGEQYVRISLCADIELIKKAETKISQTLKEIKIK